MTFLFLVRPHDVFLAQSRNLFFLENTHEFFFLYPKIPKNEGNEGNTHAHDIYIYIYT